MCQWIFIVFLIVVSIAVDARFYRTGHTSSGHRIHHRFHRSFRTQREPHNPYFYTPAQYEDECQTSEPTRPKMACPRNHPSELLTCIEADELCDKTPDCPNGEDEDRLFCLFKKLEDAEILRITSDMARLHHSDHGDVKEKVIYMTDTEEQTTAAPVEKPKATDVENSNEGPIAQYLKSRGVKTIYIVENSGEEGIPINAARG